MTPAEATGKAATSTLPEATDDQAAPKATPATEPAVKPGSDNSAMDKGDNGKTAALVQ